MDSWLIRAAARTIFSAARNSPSALTMLVFVNISFTHIIPNANQAAWLSGGLLKQSHPNAEVGHCGTIRAYCVAFLALSVNFLQLISGWTGEA